MPYTSGESKRSGDALEERPRKRHTITPAPYDTDSSNSDDVVLLDYDSEYGSEDDLFEEDLEDDSIRDDLVGDQQFEHNNEGRKHVFVDVCNYEAPPLPTAAVPAQGTASLRAPSATSTSGSKGVAAWSASDALSRPTPSRPNPAVTSGGEGPACLGPEATRSKDIWDIALDTFKSFESTIRIVLESADLEGTYFDHACLDGFLSAEMVVTLSTSCPSWSEFLSNANAVVTGAHMVQDHWVSNDMLYLNITNDTKNLPQLPYNLLSQAILQSQPRGLQPQRVRIENAEGQPRSNPSRNKKWHHDQCLALFMQYHVGLNAADLASVMGWLREYQHRYSIPWPENELLRRVYPLVTETLGHVGDPESEVTRPRTTRLLSKRTDRKWAILLTSPVELQRQQQSWVT